jgi:hypothetical protein
MPTTIDAHHRIPSVFWRETNNDVHLVADIAPPAWDEASAFMGDDAGTLMGSPSVSSLVAALQ